MVLVKWICSWAGGLVKFLKKWLPIFLKEDLKSNLVQDNFLDYCGGRGGKSGSISACVEVEPLGDVEGIV